MNDQKSQLVPTGIVLILMSFAVPPMIIHLATPLPESTLKFVMFILVDLFRICFFAGIACIIIGALRNRKRKSEEKKEVDSHS